ncbi:MAG: hypothetical protein GWO23_25555, partial [Gammaproteobacteria bacterium]|nr:hypothetical protein [Gammaproteobacteria bacterium]
LLVDAGRNKVGHRFAPVVRAGLLAMIFNNLGKLSVELPPNSIQSAQRQNNRR